MNHAKFIASNQMEEVKRIGLLSGDSPLNLPQLLPLCMISFPEIFKKDKSKSQSALVFMNIHAGLHPV